MTKSLPVDRGEGEQMTLSANQPAISDPLMKRIAWRLAPLMIMIYIANQLDRANVGYAALTMNADLHMSTAQYGLATSLFFLGYILFEVPSNLCMHRYGARLWMTRILVSWGVLSSLTCLVGDRDVLRLLLHGAPTPTKTRFSLGHGS